jgi:chemotaxis regulatin CheY-phosphate phosphatase CheZ
MKFKEFMSNTASQAGANQVGNNTQQAMPQDQQKELSNLITRQDWDDMSKQFHNNLVQGMTQQDLNSRIQQFLQGKMNNPHKTQQTLSNIANQGMGHIQQTMNQTNQQS